MLKIYVADTAALSEERVFWEYMDRVDETRQEKVWQCRNEEDRKRSLLAGYLIQVGVRNWMDGVGGHHAGEAPLSLSYTYGRNGKPFLKDYGEVCFSLSHSGRYVMGAFSNHEVGVDVQKHRETRLDMARRFFAGEDKALLERLGEEHASDNFYRIWAVKESYMKLTGEGMRQGMDATVLEPEGEGLCCGRILRKDRKTGDAYFVLSDRLEEYSMAVCSSDKLADIKYKEIIIGKASDGKMTGDDGK